MQQHTPLNNSTILSVFIARVFLFTPFMTVAGCIPILMEEWGIGAAKVSSIVSSFYFAYAFSLLGFSWLGDRIGAKRTVLLSACATVFAGAAFAVFAEDFMSSLILYGLIGLCQGGVYGPLIMLFRENVPSDRLGSAIGWLIASTSIGYAASIALTGLFVGISGWRMAFMATGLLPIAGTAILLVAVKQLPNTVHPRTSDTGFWRQIRQNRPARQLIAAYTCHNWELLGMWTWAPALIAASFVMSGETTTVASGWSAQVVTALHLGGAIAAYAMGRLSDRVGRRSVLIWVAAIAAGFSFGIGWFVTFAPYLIAGLAIVYSFFAIGDSPVLSTAMAERVEPGSLGAMLAARSLIGFIVGAASPAVVGWLIDTLRAGQASETVVWGSGFAILGLGGLLAVFFAFRLPK
ncbi:MAG: MFS transporter [Alphaproteobacteria bacterium]|nr:MFS transporter [Alphaproteobacteria bacterium]